MPEPSNPIPPRSGAPVVLLTDTSGYATASRMAIALAVSGARVEAVCPQRDHCLLKTRAVPKTYPYSWFDPAESLSDAIDAAKPDIVIPCDDRGVQDLHELYCLARAANPRKKSLMDLIERSLGPAESFPIALSRHGLLKIAREEGIRVPATELVQSVADLDAWATEHAFPWVLKADGSWGGRGVRIVYNQLEAERAFQQITRPPRATHAVKRWIIDRDAFWLRPWWRGTTPAVIVQTFVQGRPANCAAVCWRGKALAGIGVEAVSTQDATGPATVVRILENEEMARAAERIAARLGLSGFIGLDFVLEESTGAAYLIEMNPRCTPLCHLQLGPGRDMVSAIYAQLSGQPVREIALATSNELIAYFPRAWTFNKELLPSCFQDIPRDEPELVEELLRPDRTRRFIFRRLARRRAQKAANERTHSPHPASR